jgi:DNA-directed RNA polymerase subunit RPC12/RpoP
MPKIDGRKRHEVFGFPNGETVGDRQLPLQEGPCPRCGFRIRSMMGYGTKGRCPQCKLKIFMKEWGKQYA